MQTQGIHISKCLKILTPAVVALMVGVPSGAIDRLSMNIERLQRAGVDARGIEVQMNFPTLSSSPVSIRIERVDLGGALGRFEDLSIDCPLPVIREPVFSCTHAQVRARSSRFGIQNLQASLVWNDQTRTISFEAAGLRVAGGRVSAQGVWGAREWTVSLTADTIALAAARAMLGNSLPLPPDWSLEGSLANLNAQLTGAASLRKVNLQATLSGVSLANPDGTTAADQLAATVTVHANRSGTGWQFDATATSAHGEALSGKWYWNFSKQPLQAHGRGQFSDAGALLVQDAQLSLGGFLQAGARGEIDLAALPRIRTLQVRLDDMRIAELPPQTRDGILSGSLVSQLQGSGHLSGNLELQNDVPTMIDLTLQAVALEDQTAKLALSGLNGHLVWHDLERRKQALNEKTDDTQSQLSWDAGLLYGVQIGGAQVRFTTAANDVRLVQGVRIPILDGGLDIRTLQLRRLGEPAMSIRFDATLDPISVAQLCKAFGWPEFAGKLSGRIPDLTLEAGVLTLGGALQASVFDGALSVKDLKLSDPFGARPRLQANVSFSRLDLAAVTGAFSVGKITGRIDGQISALELVGWEPMAFDASLYSSPGDRTRKRISQRAVQNISSIGGGAGAAAALQRSVLRFFNEFNYDKLGISCRLSNDVCLMQGVEARAEGYYLVKGSGLPRIDVIGDAHRVDWPSLVATLKELPKSQPSIGNAP